VKALENAQIRDRMNSSYAELKIFDLNGNKEVHGAGPLPTFDETGLPGTLQFRVEPK